MTIVAWPTRSADTVLTGLCTRLEASDGSTVASGGWLLQENGGVSPTNFSTGSGAGKRYQFSVTVDKGAGPVEVACFAKGEGRYPSNDKYHALYIEIAVDGTVPIYPAITAGNAATRWPNVPATSTANGWVVAVRLTVPSSFAPLNGDVRQVNNPATPASMFEDPATGFVVGSDSAAGIAMMGRTNAVILCTNPDYNTKCGAIRHLLTRAEEENVATWSGSSDPAGLTAAIVLHNTNFDRFQRDMRWNNVRSEPGYVAHFTQRHRGNTAAHDEAGQSIDLTVPQRSENYYPTDPPGMSASIPQDARWRVMAGGIGFVDGNNPNYYDAAYLFFKKYLQTGDLAYYQRAASLAIAWRHAWRFSTAGGTGLSGYADCIDLRLQPQGLAASSWLTGDPECLNMLEVVNTRTSNLAYFVSTSRGYGEPRPMSRYCRVARLAHLCSRPANAGYPEGNVPGTLGNNTTTVEAAGWGAIYTAIVDAIMNGSTHVVSGPPTVDGSGYYVGHQGGGPNREYWTTMSTASPGVNYRYYQAAIGGEMVSPTYDAFVAALDKEKIGLASFMQPILMDPLIDAAMDDGATIGGTLQTTIQTDGIANADYMYRVHWDGSPELNVNHPQPGDAPGYRAMFNGDPHGDQYAWYYSRRDLTNMYHHTQSWAAMQSASGSRRALAERILRTAVGGWGTTGNTAGGAIGDYVGPKQTTENHIFFAESLAALAHAPAAAAISFDVVSAVLLSSTAIGTSPGAVVSFQALFVDTRLVKLATTPTVTSSNPSVCSVASVTPTTTVNGTRYLVAVQANAVGAADITVQDTPTGISNVFQVAVNAPQVSEDWSSNSIRSLLWTADPPTGNGLAPTAASGALVIAVNPGFSAATSMVHQKAACSLDVGPLVLKVSATSVYLNHAYLVLRDASGNGFGFNFATPDGTNVLVRSNFQNAGADGGSSSGVFLPARPFWSRIRKLDSTHFICETSPDQVTWTPTENNTAGYPIPSGTNTSAMKLSLEINDNGSGPAMSITLDDITWSDTTLPGGPVADHLTVTTQPSTPVASGVPHATPPAGAIVTSAGTTVTTDTSTVTATLILESGTASAIGTLSTAAVAGAWSFAGKGLGATSTLGAVAHWRFADGSLLGADSASFTIAPPSGPVPASMVVIGAPARAVSGATLAPAYVVEVLDGLGVLCTTGTGATAPITIAITAGHATLVGSATVSAVGGVSAFSGLALTGSLDETLTVTISSPGLPSLSFPLIFSTPAIRGRRFF